MKNQVLLIGIVAGLSVMATACGTSSNQSLINSVKLSSYQQDGDTYVKVGAIFNMGNTTLGSFTLPIVDPHNPNTIYGSISALQAFSGGIEIDLAVNLNDAVHLNLVEGTLPNGTVIPVGGLGNTPVIGIPVGSSGARVYVAYGSGVALAGFAVPLGAFDSMGSQAGYVNIFPMFDFGSGVKGLAGIFTGAQSKQSGIAFFVDASTALNSIPAATQAVVASSASKSVARVASASMSGPGSSMSVGPSSLVFRSVRASNRATDSVNASLYNLHRKRASLRPLLK